MTGLLVFGTLMGKLSGKLLPDNYGNNLSYQLKQCYTHQLHRRDLRIQRQLTRVYIKGHREI